MKRLVPLLTLALVASGSAAMLAAPPAIAATPTIKVMPLGDSITFGVGSSTGSSYRLDLYQRLVRQAGYTIDFVGTQRSGSLPDTDNEGHSGWRIDQIASNVDGWLATYQPNLVLLHIGTNDMNQNFQVSTAPNRLSALIDQITTDVPAATVVVASLIPANDATIQARINTFNASVPGIVAAKQQAGKRVRLVDMASLTTADLADTLHPNDSGYAKMSTIFYAGAAQALRDGRDAPLFQSGFEPGEPAPNWLDTTAASLNVGGYCCGLSKMEASPRQELAHGGVNALMYSGNDTSATQSYAYAREFDVHIPVDADTELSYWVLPQQANGTHVAVDFLFTDGSSLRDSGVADQFGVRVHPQFQGQGGHLAVGAWTRVRARLGVLAGKVIDEIRVGYDQPAGTGGFRGYVDDITIKGLFAGYPGENLLLKKPSTGSAACAATETADRAVNGAWSGGNGDKWCSAAAIKSWQADIGGTATIRQVVIRHAGAGNEPTGSNTRDFSVSVSTDGTNWTVLFGVSGNTDSVTTRAVTPTLARFVRLDVTAGTQGAENVARIYEVEAYG
jgi:lysophospholipase L1-like esterase